MARAHVAVLRGGPSHTYDLSLRTGNEYLTHLDTLGVPAQDIFVDKQGTWHRRGIPVPLHVALEGVDVVLNTLSGEYAEDGQLRQELAPLGVRLPGTSTFASHIAFDKARARHRIPSIPGVHVPQMVVFHAVDFKDKLAEAVDELFHTFGPPYVIKPLRGSASVSTVVARTIPEAIEALELAFIIWDAVVVEEYIRGTEVTCGVVENFRDADVYTFPAVEIRIPKGHDVLDYQTKFAHNAEYICPTTLSFDTKTRIEDASRLVHQELGLGTYSRADFKVHPSGRIYFLEVNTEPEMSTQSPFGVALDAVGVPLPAFLEHLVERA